MGRKRWALTPPVPENISRANLLMRSAAGQTGGKTGSERAGGKAKNKNE